MFVTHEKIPITYAPAEDRTCDPWHKNPILCHIAIKAGLYRHTVQIQVCIKHVPNSTTCFLTDSLHIIICSICLNFMFQFYIKQQFNMSSTGWCFLFEIIYGVKGEVSCKRLVFSIAFFPM